MISRRSFYRSIAASTLAAALLLSTAPAIAQTKDHAPVALKSSSKMEQDKAGSESWTYAQSREVFTKYRTLIVDNTSVYNGPDAQFDGIEAADRAKFATIVTDELRSELAKSFANPASVQADTLRLKVTLLGAEKTKGGIATATRVTPMGFGLSALKSAVGKGGSFTGSVLFAVELYDARTNELLLAAVRRRHPDPLDVPATLGTEETVKAVAREFADGARKRLKDLTGVQD
jgi:hypothetical protein